MVAEWRDLTTARYSVVSAIFWVCATKTWTGMAWGAPPPCGFFEAELVLHPVIEAAKRAKTRATFWAKAAEERVRGIFMYRFYPSNDTTRLSRSKARHGCPQLDAVRSQRLYGSGWTKISDGGATRSRFSRDGYNAETDTGR